MIGMSSEYGTYRICTLFLIHVRAWHDGDDDLLVTFYGLPEDVREGQTSLPEGQ
jgi:hypothetical protein